MAAVAAIKSPVRDGWSVYWRISAKEGGGEEKVEKKEEGGEEERVEKKEGVDVDGGDGIEEAREAVAAPSLAVPPPQPRVCAYPRRERMARAERILR